ncbi:MAG: CehA/McbA family metallohydrolase, partial [Pirellulales bacterium]
SPLHDASRGEAEPPQTITPRDVMHRWMDVSTYDKAPLNERLSGLALEYRILELFSRDRGPREAKLQFDVGQGTQDLGFRSELNLVFNCQKCVRVKLEVLDDDGAPTTGHFVFRDERGRVYPARSRRLAPDFFFHDQVYRQHGEEVLLPSGNYRVTYTRGPEYEVLEREIKVPDRDEHTERFRMKRWINLAAAGWFSGDHHVHAAGCAHYSSPTQGVGPADMMRHILGEDLNVGCVLTWGPCWYHQKEHFDGQVHSLSTPRNVMRYDVEVSGFPSSHAGHVVLLRLTEDDYPGTKRIEEWPSWDLPILQWGKRQGGIVGYAHSGWGLSVPAKSLPTFDMPAFDGIGANEYIVDVTHDACDFISSVDTPFVWELNIWYHTLNCGFTTRISGETDFPCIYGQRVGLGRVNVKMPGDEPLD